MSDQPWPSEENTDEFPTDRKPAKKFEVQPPIPAEEPEPIGPEPFDEPSPEPPEPDPEPEIEEINEHNDDPKKTYDDSVVEVTAAVSRIGSSKPLEIDEIDTETHAPVELERVVDAPEEEE